MDAAVARETTKTFFIKLGTKGGWEKDCIADGTIQFGYHATPHALCLAGDWSAVERALLDQGKKQGVASNDLRQIKTFYTARQNDIFITFSAGYLWWCHASEEAYMLPDHSKVRKTLDGWHNTSLGGVPLVLSKLSGALLKTRMFQGTICAVEAQEYLLRKLFDQALPAIVALDDARSAMASAVLQAVQLLGDRDFELLVELIFASSGWRRLNKTGGSEKTIDLDLVLPSTGERAFVQVKSKVKASTYQAYEDEFLGNNAYTRMFFVWHSGDVGTRTHEAATLWGPEKVADMVIEAGLISWVRDKVG